MLQRCYNPNNKAYKNYGARGIGVCDEWKGSNGITNFYIWATQNGYKEKLTIERKDGNEGYSPENCIWAIYKVQLNNTRRNRFVTLNGVTKTVSQWSDETGVNSNTIFYRLVEGKLGEELIAHSKNDMTISGVKGVTWNKSSKNWIARYQENKNRIYLGSFKELKDAIEARRSYEIQRQINAAQN